jgi:hypothetical protein
MNNLQENIRRILREETELPIFIRRRVTDDDLEWLVNDVKELIDYGESLDTAIYDGTREFIKSRKFPDIYEFGPDADYWESYLRYERPLVDYVKKKLRITDNVNESILREESKMSTYLRRRLEMLDYEVESRIGKGFYSPDVVCVHYKNEEDLFDAIMESSIENMYWNYFVTMEEEWPTIYLDMVKYVRSKYGDEIRNYYADNCFNKRKVMNLKETTKEVMWLKRRLQSPDITRDLKMTVINNMKFLGPCWYDSSEHWFDSVIKRSVENFINHWEDLYDADDMVELDDFVYEIINDRYGNKIRNVYKNRICG